MEKVMRREICCMLSSNSKVSPSISMLENLEDEDPRGTDRFGRRRCGRSTSPTSTK
jgi:hypothetical protein